MICRPKKWVSDTMIQLIQRFAGWFQLLFVVAVVGAAILVSTSLKPETSNGLSNRAPDAIAVTVVEPEPIVFEPSVRLHGVVAARTITEVVPQVGGRVVAVSPAFRPGASFAEGDVLFRIEAADYELAVQRTLSEIEAARSELALLEAQAAAEKQVWDQQFADRKIPDLVARVPQIAAVKARIQSGEAARAAAELSLARTVVRAPFDGRVLQTRLDVGQVVGAGATVGSVFSHDSLEISAPVSSEEMALLGSMVGRPATILRERGATLHLAAEVVRQSAALDERTRLRTLFLAPDDAAELTLGEFVAVDIRGDATQDVYRVPAASLTSRDQVWVVDNGSLREREVDLVGSDQDIAIVRAFDTADGIVAIPPANSRDGLPVTVQTERRIAGAGSVAVGAP